MHVSLSGYYCCSVFSNVLDALEPSPFINASLFLLSCYTNHRGTKTAVFPNTFFLKNKTTIYILPYSVNTITKRLKHEFLGNLAMDRFLVTIFQWSKVHFSLWFPKRCYWAWFAFLRSHTGKVLFSRLFSLSCKLTPNEPTIFQYLSWTPLQLKVFASIQAHSRPYINNASMRARN